MSLNAYKEAWLAETMLNYTESRSVSRSMMKEQKRRKQMSSSDMLNVAARQKAEGMILKGAHVLSKHAAQSQIKGKIGIGLRVGGRIGTRLIPIVGTAMLAYDLYRAYEYLTD